MRCGAGQAAEIFGLQGAVNYINRNNWIGDFMVAIVAAELGIDRSAFEHGERNGQVIRSALVP